MSQEEVGTSASESARVSLAGATASGHCRRHSPRWQGLAGLVAKYPLVVVTPRNSRFGVALL